ncbi:unnamed protein product [Tetraodon nigroviridis]|uniref:(spotted green pufferfish) hypothetical protein n=1 Tax=Tetraodon nigroviridis TaxID=99883 RepID=Q4SWT4_TETNG|nr:unnamed protein product [Tetraodon nigroviridis]
MQTRTRPPSASALPDERWTTVSLWSAPTETRCPSTRGRSLTPKAKSKRPTTRSTELEAELRALPGRREAVAELQAKMRRVVRVSEATETTPLASRSKAAGRWSKLCSPLLSTDQPGHELVLRQLSKEAMAAWSGDPDGVPDYLGATLRSLQSILGTDTFGLVEETVPQSSFRPNYSLVSRGESPGRPPPPPKKKNLPPQKRV